MLCEARALRTAFPDAEAMRGLPIGDLPPEGSGEGAAELRAALAYLRDEMLMVRAGRARDLTVLDDEIAYAESLVVPADR